MEPQLPASPSQSSLSILLNSDFKFMCEDFFLHINIKPIDFITKIASGCLFVLSHASRNNKINVTFRQPKIIPSKLGTKPGVYQNHIRVDLEIEQHLTDNQIPKVFRALSTHIILYLFSKMNNTSERDAFCTEGLKLLAKRVKDMNWEAYSQNSNLPRIILKHLVYAQNDILTNPQTTSLHLRFQGTNNIYLNLNFFVRRNQQPPYVYLPPKSCSVPLIKLPPLDTIDSDSQPKDKKNLDVALSLEKIGFDFFQGYDTVTEDAILGKIKKYRVSNNVYVWECIFQQIHGRYSPILNKELWDILEQKFSNFDIYLEKERIIIKKLWGIAVEQLVHLKLSPVELIAHEKILIQVLKSATCFSPSEKFNLYAHIITCWEKIFNYPKNKSDVLHKYCEIHKEWVDVLKTFASHNQMYCELTFLYRLLQQSGFKELKTELKEIESWAWPKKESAEFKKELVQLINKIKNKIQSLNLNATGDVKLVLVSFLELLNEIEAEQIGQFLLNVPSTTNEKELFLLLEKYFTYYSKKYFDLPKEKQKVFIEILGKNIQLVLKLKANDIISAYEIGLCDYFLVSGDVKFLNAHLDYYSILYLNKLPAYHRLVTAISANFILNKNQQQTKNIVQFVEVLNTRLSADLKAHKYSYEGVEDFLIFNWFLFQQLFDGNELIRDKSLIFLQNYADNIQLSPQALNLKKALLFITQVRTDTIDPQFILDWLRTDRAGYFNYTHQAIYDLLKYQKDSMRLFADRIVKSAVIHFDDGMAGGNFTQSLMLYMSPTYHPERVGKSDTYAWVLQRLKDITECVLRSTASTKNKTTFLCEFYNFKKIKGFNLDRLDYIKICEYIVKSFSSIKWFEAHVSNHLRMHFLFKFQHVKTVLSLTTIQYCNEVITQAINDFKWTGGYPNLEDLQRLSLHIQSYTLQPKDVPQQFRENLSQLQLEYETCLNAVDFSVDLSQLLHSAVSNAYIPFSCRYSYIQDCYFAIANSQDITDKLVYQELILKCIHELYNNGKFLMKHLHDEDKRMLTIQYKDILLAYIKSCTKASVSPVKQKEDEVYTKDLINFILVYFDIKDQKNIVKEVYRWFIQPQFLIYPLFQKQIHVFKEYAKEKGLLS